MSVAWQRDHALPKRIDMQQSVGGMLNNVKQTTQVGFDEYTYPGIRVSVTNTASRGPVWI